MVGRTISVIVTKAQKAGVGKDGILHRRVAADMEHFRRVIADPKGEGPKKPYAVIMGRVTWDTIATKFRPGQTNVVLTKAAAVRGFVSPYPEGVIVAPSVAAAVELLGAIEDIGEIFVISGETICKEAMEVPSCERLFVPRMGMDVESDAFFPAIHQRGYQITFVSKSHSSNGLPYDFVVYERPEASQRVPSRALTAIGGGDLLAHEEYQYLQAIKEIIEKGVAMEDRTGVCTLSTFGKTMRFDLRETFPLFTTRGTFWRGVLEELLWFVRGDTNAKHLSAKGVKLWDANGSREFLDKRGLSHREDGDLGPVYGFQWRHFGAKYVDMHTDYTGQGVDQLADCIRKIKEDPTDRRILLSAWNPADLGRMALPPCRMFCQFYVANGELSCLMYQRSCDMGIGVPFNIASYSLLTLMVAQVCGLSTGEFVHSMGHAHVYKNHVEPLKRQLERTPRPFPVLKINPDVKDIDGFKASDFELVGYHPHGKIAMEVAM